MNAESLRFLVCFSLKIKGKDPQLSHVQYAFMAVHCMYVGMVEKRTACISHSGYLAIASNKYNGFVLS